MKLTEDNDPLHVRVIASWSHKTRRTQYVPVIMGPAGRTGNTTIFCGALSHLCNFAYAEEMYASPGEAAEAWQEGEPVTFDPELTRVHMVPHEMAVLINMRKLYRVQKVAP